jgi:nucleotide-binding universal stress UspA family protein
MSGIVVGVDGSPGSALALEWAMHHAARRQAALTVLSVYQAVESPWTGNATAMFANASDIEQIRHSSEEMVAKAASTMPDPPKVTVKVVTGFPAAELISESEDAELVVVGSRGAGGFARLLVGSVSNQVVHHAKCPIAVIPPQR